MLIKRNYLLYAVLVVILLFSVQCSMDVGSSDLDDPVVGEETASSQWVADSFTEAVGETRGRLHIESIERVHLKDDIYKYEIIVKVGNDEHDKIGIYRVVKERFPWRPIRTEDGMMLLHGSGFNFDLAYLPSTVVDAFDPDQSMALYLAENDIDVWGLDLRWTFIPDDAVDLSILRGQNIALELQDLNLALQIMRISRRMTGSGYDEVILAGHNLGAILTWAHANGETQKHKRFKHVKGIIALDALYKTDDPVLSGYAYNRYNLYQDLNAAGVYFEKDVLMFKAAASMAKYYPDQPSQMVPGFTNEQTFVFFVSAMYATFITPWEPYTPYFHYCAGVFNEYGIPIGFQFAPTNAIVDTIMGVPSYVSNVDIMDQEAILSDVVENPYDDYLGEIDLPILNISCAGGYAEYAQYVNSLTASTDVTSLVIRLYPQGYEAIDFGSTDLLYASNAEQLAWQPMAAWVETH